MRCERVALAVDDLVEAEEFYAGIMVEILGGYLANRYLLTTDEVLQAQRATALATRRGEAPTAALPFTRVIVGGAHLYLCLSDCHIPAAPPEQLRGTPRVALSTTEEQLARAVVVFEREGVRYEGPVSYPPPSWIAQAVYLRDPAGNFLELACSR